MSADDLSAVWTAIKARAAAEITGLPIFWPREPNEMPDTPAPFVYFELIVDKAGAPVSYGGGRGRNTYRNGAELNGYVFVPRNYTVEAEAALSERVAAAFRSYRSDVISCFDATPMLVGNGSDLVPAGFESAADQYECTVVAIDLFFDQIG